jgi:tetratricopeptide (TPR) repeat protein
VVTVRAICALLVLTLCGSTARAEDRERARQAFTEGRQHFDLGEYKEALASFKEAYRDFEDPTFLFNIAQCHRQLGDKEQAVRMYRTYVSKRPDAPNAEEVRRTIATLQEAIDKERASRASPPTGTLSPSEAPPTETAPPAATTPAAPSAPEAEHHTPIYKKWWLWTIVGVVVVGAAVGTGVGIAASKPSHPTATTDFGTLTF